MNPEIQYTDEELRITLSVLKKLRAEDPEHDDNLYTTDHVVDMMIEYFAFLQFEAKCPLSPKEAYDRAMGIVAK